MAWLKRDSPRPTLNDPVLVTQVASSAVFPVLLKIGISPWSGARALCQTRDLRQVRIPFVRFMRRYGLGGVSGCCGPRGEGSGITMI